MKKIMLVCALGMSTSLMVSKMEKAAEEKGKEVEITAVPESEAYNLISQTDIVMLGPQVSYVFDNFKQQAETFGVPVVLIDALDYGRMNGEKVLDDALAIIENRGTRE
jgi:Phosphotransferase system cellobiose-specific component IIB